MGKLRHLRIEYEGNRDVFFQGDFVRGRVILEVDADQDQVGLKHVKGRVFLNCSFGVLVSDGDTNLTCTVDIGGQSPVVHDSVQGDDSTPNLSSRMRVYIRRWYGYACVNTKD